MKLFNLLTYDQFLKKYSGARHLGTDKYYNYCNLLCLYGKKMGLYDREIDIHYNTERLHQLFNKYSSRTKYIIVGR